MKFLRKTCRSRLGCTVALTTSLILLILLHRHGFSRKIHLDSPVCSFPNDDPICNLLSERFADFPSPKNRPHLDVGAQWCPGVVLNKPNFPGGLESQTWQDVHDRNVIVFSAFLDIRRQIGGPLIRIIASGLQEQFNHVGQLFCTLWYVDIDLPVSVGPAIYDRIYHSLLHPGMWVAHFILCPVPVIGDISVPYAVSVTARSCESPSNALMILNRIPEESIGQFSFAACFPPIYGKMGDLTNLLEWIELYKILGIKSIFFYNFSMDADVSRALHGYQENRADHVNIIQWKFPDGKLNSYFSQRSAINDCLYRAGHSHKYVAIVDIDEVVMPRGHSDWVEMMTSLSRTNVGAYLFQHAYFRRNTTGEKPYLITQQSLWRTDIVTPPGKIRCKSLYVASSTIKADIHFPYSLLEKHEEYVVPPEVAILHHYRQDPMENFRKNPEKYNFIEDKHMNRYKNELTRRVLKRLDDLYLRSRNASRKHSHGSRQRT